MGGAHQELPHQHPLRAPLPQTPHVLGGGDPGLRDRGDSVGDLLQQGEGALQVHREVAQIAVVDPDDLGPHVDRATQLGAVVNLHEHIESQLARGAVQRGERGLIERRHDQQHRVGARGARLV